MDLKEKYTDPKYHAAFTGKNKFINAIKNENKDNYKKIYIYSKIDKTLKGIDSYSLHKPTRKTKVFRRIYAEGIGDIFQIDLVDIKKHIGENDGFRYIITIIDVFSKKAWAFKSIQKTGETLFNILKPFFAKNKCKQVSWDKGSEFYNEKVLKLLKQKKIGHFSVTTKRKAAIVERFNRTLKTRMFRSFTSRGNNRWIDILDDLVKGYNNTKHRSIGLAPNEVNSENEYQVKKKLYPAIIKKRNLVKPFFKVGDTVRIATKKQTFQKGYEQTFSYLVYKISKIKYTYPITYEITDFKDKVVKKTFYKNDLQIVDKTDNIWPINKVLGRKKVRGKIQRQVNFFGYPEDVTYWIPESQLFNNYAH